MESKVLDNHPAWWGRVVTSALPVIKKDHGIAEGLLGIGRMLESGEAGDAKRLAIKLTEQIAMSNGSPNLPGELDSTQLARMMEDKRYPGYLKEIIKSALEKSDPSLP